MAPPLRKEVSTLIRRNITAPPLDSSSFRIFSMFDHHVLMTMTLLIPRQTLFSRLPVTMVHQRARLFVWLAPLVSTQWDLHPKALVIWLINSVLFPSKEPLCIHLLLNSSNQRAVIIIPCFYLFRSMPWFPKSVWFHFDFVSVFEFEFLKMSFYEKMY